MNSDESVTFQKKTNLSLHEKIKLNKDIENLSNRINRLDEIMTENSLSQVHMYCIPTSHILARKKASIRF